MAVTFAASYEATPETVSVVRGQMAALARECGLDDGAINDVKLAVSEAATNALVHAYKDRPGMIRVEARIENRELVIAVADEGEGMKPRSDSPGLGLGLPVIASVARRLEIVDEGPGTELRMAFDCPRHSAPG
jgi:serine/threonine-protein kinase RsbW/stage II sporulation protein AB (anti-sigma F factor)